MSSPSEVRFAGPSEFEQVWYLMRMSYGENAVFPLSMRKAAGFVRRALAGQEGAIGVIGPEEGELEALAFLSIGTFWYSERPHLEEYMVFVHPDHRKSQHAKALMRWMKQQVNETGLPLMTGIFSESARNEAKCRLYQREFPKLGEFFFFKPNSSTVATSS